MSPDMHKAAKECTGGKNDNAAPMLLYAAPYFTRLAHPMQNVYSGQ